MTSQSHANELMKFARIDARIAHVWLFRYLQKAVASLYLVVNKLLRLLYALANGSEQT